MGPGGTDGATAEVNETRLQGATSSAAILELALSHFYCLTWRLPKRSLNDEGPSPVQGGADMPGRI